MKSETVKHQKLWHAVSGILLLIYLAYFHLLNLATPSQVPILGACFGSLWLVACFCFQTAFKNRFEFGIHTLLTIDFYLEALVTKHSGYGFYFCALGFWSIFLIYHHLHLASRFSPSELDHLDAKEMWPRQPAKL